MFVLRRVPAALALLMLGAHFLRGGNLLGMLLSLALLVPLFVPLAAAQGVVRWALYLGALVWVGALVQGVQLRLAFGEPWLRLALILGGVALFTALTAWPVRLRPRIPEAAGD